MLGHPVLYRFRPGQVRAGQQDAAALVTRVNADGSLDLAVFPALGPNSEFLTVNKVRRMSQEVTSNCWHPLEGDPLRRAMDDDAPADGMSPSELNDNARAVMAADGRKAAKGRP